MTRALWLVLGLGLPQSALAQVELTMEFEKVLVTPVQAHDAERSAEAARVGQLLHAIISESNVMIELEDVPRFEGQEYDNLTYIQSCPEEQYAGCALVMGQQGQANWVVGGTLEPVAGLQGGESQLTVHVVDVQGSREVMAFGVVVGGATDDNAVLRSVAGVFDSVVAGLAEEIDVRGDLDDPLAAEALSDRREKLIAASLQALEAELGQVIREDIAMGRLEAPKVKRRDLAEFDVREDAAPWEKLRMSKAQYIRFENSGTTIVEWRRRIRGRLGQLLLRVDFGGGPGPWGLHHEGRWLVDFDDASNAFVNREVHQYQEARRSGSSQVQFELGFGVAPWVEVAGVVGLRNAPFTYRFDQDSAADAASVVPEPTRTTGRTSELGARVVFAPMPTYQVRPTVHAGFFSWKGSAVVPDQEPLVSLEAPKATYVQFGPGVEASAGRYMNVFLRGHMDLVTSGVFIDEKKDGVSGSLADFDDPLGEYTGGWGVQAGFQVRLSLLKDPSDDIMGRGGAGGGDEEEPDF